MTCATPRSFPELLDYWTGELPPADAAALEEHLFACDACSGRLSSVQQLASGVDRLARAGRFRSVVPPTLVDRLVAAGVRVRTFRISPGGLTPCGVGTDDELLVARLAADLRGVERVDLVTCDDGGRERERARDVPFDASGGEVVLAERVDRARGYPTHVLRMRLLALGPGGERVIGEYALAHDAAAPPHP